MEYYLVQAADRLGAFLGNLFGSAALSLFTDPLVVLAGFGLLVLGIRQLLR